MAAVNEMRLPDFSVCLQAQAGIMPLKGKCIPRVQRVVLLFEGIAVGAFVDDKKSGRYLNAPFFTGLTLRQAVEKADREFDSPYDK